jgi:hypothetical protein
MTVSLIGKEKKRMKIIPTLTMVLVLIAAGCSSPVAAPAGEEPTITPASTTAKPTTVLTSITPTNTTEPVSQFQSFPGVGCCRGKIIEPGEYQLPTWLGIPLTLDVGEGWRVMNEEQALLFLLAGQGRNSFGDPSQVLVFIAIPDGDPQQVLTPIRNSPELISVGELSETTIAGFSGWQFDAMVKANPGNEGSPENGIPPGAQSLPAINKYFTPGFLWTTWTAEPRLRFIALNVGQQGLLLEIESPPAEFEAFVSESAQVLQTLELAE